MMVSEEVYAGTLELTLPNRLEGCSDFALVAKPSNSGARLTLVYKDADGKQTTLTLQRVHSLFPVLSVAKLLMKRLVELEVKLCHVEHSADRDAYPQCTFNVHVTLSPLLFWHHPANRGPPVAATEAARTAHPLTFTIKATGLSLAINELIWLLAAADEEEDSTTRVAWAEEYRDVRDHIFEIASPTDWTVEQPEPEGLKCMLYRYQRRALAWMSWREGHSRPSIPSTSTNPPADVPASAPAHNFMWERVKLRSGTHIYINTWSGWLGLQPPPPFGAVSGGILADEMGLGKTVETIALLLLNPAPWAAPMLGRQQSVANSGGHEGAAAAVGGGAVNANDAGAGAGVVEAGSRAVHSGAGAAATTVHGVGIAASTASTPAASGVSPVISAHDTAAVPASATAASSAGGSSRAGVGVTDGIDEVIGAGRGIGHGHEIAGVARRRIATRGRGVRSTGSRPPISVAVPEVEAAPLPSATSPETIIVRDKLLGPSLIVTPPALIQQWENELTQHSSLRVCVYDGVQWHLKEAAAEAKKERKKRLQQQQAGNLLDMADRVQQKKKLNLQAQTVVVGELDMASSLQEVAASLLKCDVVLTTYAVLQKESNYWPADAKAYEFRYTKKYKVLESPLLQIHWWRLVLDEAQQVGPNFNTVSLVAARLSANHRWCVTGTPIGPGGLNDLNGLLHVLHYEPFTSDKTAFKRLIIDPYNDRRGRARERLEALLKPLMWRSTKQDQAADHPLPSRSLNLVQLQFPPDQRHFYDHILNSLHKARRAADQHAEEAKAKARRTSEDGPGPSAKEENQARAKTKKLQEGLQTELRQLRLACIHPQMTLYWRQLSSEMQLEQGGALSMSQIMQRMRDEAQLKLQKAERDYCAAQNIAASKLMAQAATKSKREHPGPSSPTGDSAGGAKKPWSHAAKRRRTETSALEEAIAAPLAPKSPTAAGSAPATGKAQDPAGKSKNKQPSAAELQEEALERLHASHRVAEKGIQATDLSDFSELDDIEANNASIRAWRLIEANTAQQLSHMYELMGRHDDAAKMAAIVQKKLEDVRDGANQELAKVESKLAEVQHQLQLKADRVCQQWQQLQEAGLEGVQLQHAPEWLQQLHKSLQAGKAEEALERQKQEEDASEHKNLVLLGKVVVGILSNEEQQLSHVRNQAEAVVGSTLFGRTHRRAQAALAGLLGQPLNTRSSRGVSNPGAAMLERVLQCGVIYSLAAAIGCGPSPEAAHVAGQAVRLACSSAADGTAHAEKFVRQVVKALEKLLPPLDKRAAEAGAMKRMSLDELLLLLDVVKGRMELLRLEREQYQKELQVEVAMSKREALGAEVMSAAEGHLGGYGSYMSKSLPELRTLVESLHATCMELHHRRAFLHNQITNYASKPPPETLASSGGPSDSAKSDPTKPAAPEPHATEGLNAGSAALAGLVSPAGVVGSASPAGLDRVAGPAGTASSAGAVSPAGFVGPASVVGPDGLAGLASLATMANVAANVAAPAGVASSDLKKSGAAGEAMEIDVSDPGMSKWVKMLATPTASDSEGRKFGTSDTECVACGTADLAPKKPSVLQPGPTEYAVPDHDRAKPPRRGLTDQDTPSSSLTEEAAANPVAGPVVGTEPAAVVAQDVVKQEEQPGIKRLRSGDKSPRRSEANEASTSNAASVDTDCHVGIKRSRQLMLKCEPGPGLDTELASMWDAEPEAHQASSALKQAKTRAVKSESQPESEPRPESKSWPERVTCPERVTTAQNKHGRAIDEAQQEDQGRATRARVDDGDRVDSVRPELLRSSGSGRRAEKDDEGTEERDSKRCHITRFKHAPYSAAGRSVAATGTTKPVGEAGACCCRDISEEDPPAKDLQQNGRCMDPRHADVVDPTSETESDDDLFLSRKLKHVQRQGSGLGENGAATGGVGNTSTGPLNALAAGSDRPSGISRPTGCDTRATGNHLPVSSSQAANGNGAAGTCHPSGSIQAKGNPLKDSNHLTSTKQAAGSNRPASSNQPASNECLTGNHPAGNNFSNGSGTAAAGGSTAYHVEGELRNGDSQRVEDPVAAPLACAKPRGAPTQECVVCMNAIVDSMLIFNCGHFFCEDCTVQIMQRLPPVCPVCREKVNKNQLFRAKVAIAGGHGQAGEVDPPEGTAILTVKVRGVWMTKLEGLLRRLIWLAQNFPDDKSLVFSQFPEALRLVSKALHANGLKHGELRGDKMAMREALKRFQTDADVRVFLLSLKTGAAGLTLTQANHVFLLEPALDPAIEQQAVARVHRIGQTRPVTITRFIVKDTVEGQILQRCEQKQRLFEGVGSRVLGDGEGTSLAYTVAKKEDVIEGKDFDELLDAVLLKHNPDDPAGTSR